MLMDLTLSLSRDNPVFRTLPPSHEARVMAAGHVGTHLDTLLHRPIPLEWMDRTGVLLDARPFGADIGPQVLADVDIAAGDFVLFHTGHIGRQAYGTDAYLHDTPQLAWSVVEALIDRKVSFIGIDGAGLRRGGKEHAKVDRFCEERGAYVIENLTNLDALQETAPARFPVRVAWIAHGGMTGIPVKVVAVLSDPAA